jgi:hypothetical protein
VYRLCIAIFDPKLSNKVICDVGNEAQTRFRPYWQDEKDWLCIVDSCPPTIQRLGSLPRDIIGYLVGYASLTNTRSLAVLGDPDASAYELLFSLSSPEEKNEFLNSVSPQQFSTFDNVDSQARQRSFFVACLHIPPCFIHGADDLVE